MRSRAWPIVARSIRRSIVSGVALHATNGRWPLIRIDIDLFNGYNHSFGHPAGDDCLRRVVAGLTEAPNVLTIFWLDTAAREFAVILPPTDMAGA